MSRRVLLVPVLTLALVAAVLAFARPEPTAVADEGGAEFLTAGGCKKCHFKQWRSWKKTVHFKAMDILKIGERSEAKTKAGLDPAKDYTNDAQCLGCHSTGYGQAGGYPAVGDWNDDQKKLAEENAGVGCEACHGAGSKYSPFKKDNEAYKRPEVAALGLQTPVTADNCTGCHKKEGNPTAGDDYVFDFETSKANAEGIHEHVPLKDH